MFNARSREREGSITIRKRIQEIERRTSSAGTDGHAVDKVEEVVVVAKATTVIELFAGAFNDIVVVSGVSVLTRPSLVWQ